MENGWHVNGLLTDKDDIKAACDACKNEGFQEITFGENDGKRQLTYQQLADYYPAIYNIKPIDPTLLVDIHQQEHSSWGEIKTSVHIKEAKDVKVSKIRKKKTKKTNILLGFICILLAVLRVMTTKTHRIFSERLLTVTTMR